MRLMQALPAEATEELTNRLHVARSLEDFGNADRADL